VRVIGDGGFAVVARAAGVSHGIDGGEQASYNSTGGF